MSIPKVVMASFFTAVAFGTALWPCRVAAQETSSSSASVLETSGSQSVSAAVPTQALEFIHPALRTDPGSSVTLPQGVIIKDITLGTGEEATTDKKCLVHYVLWVNDNPKIHQSSRHDYVPKPFKLTLGKGGSIPGFEMALHGMRVGGRRVVSIPAALAYGAAQSGRIPPNSTLHYDLEVVAIQADGSQKTSSDSTETSAPK
jgi:FKBP-type peptidyl-prolyl cis-trans isomerase FkpA